MIQNAFLRNILMMRPDTVHHGGRLTILLGEFAADDMEVAVVFGALHMPTVVRELTKLGHRAMPGAQWLTAIDYDEPPYMRKPTLDGWMDW